MTDIYQTTILCDAEINSIMNGYIIPFIRSNINPASIDLCLGNVWIDISTKHYVKFVSEAVTLYPHSSFNAICSLFRHKIPKLVRPTLLLTTTEEYINIPDDMYAMVKLKTTPCREGLGHPIADWIDPGFSGKLTLMLHAYKPITLHAGQRICQLVIGRMSRSAEKSYNITGHYNNQIGPTISWRESDEYTRNMG